MYWETRDIVKCFSLALEYFTTEDSTVKQLLYLNITVL